MTDHFCKLALKFCTTVRSLAQITLVFHAKFSFQNKLKSLCPFRSTLYCPLNDQRLLKKQVLSLLQITKKFITNYVSFAFITNCDCFFYQSSYKLRQVLQITTKLLRITTEQTCLISFFRHV